eukprot:TRINITY_DN6190_c0_g1_i1.p1 TRINITY_DN6190_c0_g1~~TRINITY_DN6190_c0_g1_i1.p1  ORF type:complete len:582 (-),score=67.03 TRINITY_DN6190_c0_g1_i1:93-1838(-)
MRDQKTATAMAVFAVAIVAIVASAGVGGVPIGIGGETRACMMRSEEVAVAGRVWAAVAGAKEQNEYVWGGKEGVTGMTGVTGGEAQVRVRVTFQTRQDVAAAVQGRRGAAGVTQGLHAAGWRECGEAVGSVVRVVQPDALVETFWVARIVLIRNAGRAAIEALAGPAGREAGVVSVDLDEWPVAQGLADVNQVQAANVEKSESAKSAKSVQQAEAQPNIVKVGAPIAWGRNVTGAGQVLATLDTGARRSHEALRDGYVGGAYGWFDPSAADGGAATGPVDTAGSGTHLLGVAVGSICTSPSAATAQRACPAGGAVGVAYGAKWMAARGCSGSGGSCRTSDLLRGAEWLLCPDAGVCNAAPHVVVCSWGGAGGDAFFADAIAAWRAAGILPIFSAGGSGPACGSVASPADNPGAVAVGASRQLDDAPTSRSPRGPGRFSSALGTVSSFGMSQNTTSYLGMRAAHSRASDPRQRPHLLAPADSILGPAHTGDATYVSFTGSAPAAAHVAGAALLLRQANPDAAADVDRLEALVTQQAVTNLALPLPPDGAPDCGGIPYSQFPNYIYGYGRLQVDNALPSSASR